MKILIIKNLKYGILKVWQINQFVQDIVILLHQLVIHIMDNLF
jgi:hypothetical protein